MNSEYENSSFYGKKKIDDEYNIASNAVKSRRKSNSY